MQGGGLPDIPGFLALFVVSGRVPCRAVGSHPCVGPLPGASAIAPRFSVQVVLGIIRL